MGKNLAKKLGVWGKDKIVREDEKFHAEDYYCVRCYDKKKETPAEKFWPNVDIDIKNFPCCVPCINYLRMESIIGMEDFWK